MDTDHSMSTENKPENADALLAEIHREFRDGLPARIEKLRSSLQRLDQGHDAEAAETFYRTAHSLKGTAPAFGAHALLEPATILSDLGRGWFEDGAVGPGELTGAWAALEQLSEAVDRFIAEAEGDS